MAARLWILKIIDGLFTLLGEIVLFFSVYSLLSGTGLGIAGLGLFLVALGQLAGINAIGYEDPKKLALFYMEMLEGIGRQFAYPLLVFAIYVLYRSQLFLALAFTFTLVALIKSVAIFYKARLIEKAGIIS
ncbi:MAG: hypothetical protein PHS02_00370 [Candidatus ainarchaeum sp.]|nr:hypothetical protein [Candidatus ainarchaeum sp.]